MTGAGENLLRNSSAQISGNINAPRFTVAEIFAQSKKPVSLALSPRISATAPTVAEKFAVRKFPPRPMTVAENLRVYVPDTEIKNLADTDSIRVHKHGSGKYRGKYLCLRPARGRDEKRPMLASGTPVKLEEYLAGLGIRLCIVHKTIGTCSQCRKPKVTGRI